MIDPFSVLGLEPRFDLDMGVLEKRHRELSRALHPDRYAGAPAAERRLSVAKAVEVNEAYRVLRDPIRRAEALLARAGIELVEGKEPRPSAQFLMQMMDDREALAEAKSACASAAVERLAAAVRSRHETAVSSIAADLASSAFAARDEATIARIVARVGELRYYRRFLDEVSAIEDEFSAAENATNDEQRPRPR